MTNLLALTIVLLTNGVMKLSCDVERGYYYRLERTLNLNPPREWLAVDSVEPAIDNRHDFYVSIHSAPLAFFRLRRLEVLE